MSLRVVLRRECAGGVVQTRPLQHQLDGQFGPGLAAVTRHEDQIGEVEHHLVDELDVLTERLQPRPGDAGAAEDGYAELHALGVDRVHLLVVDRHLGKGPGGEHADGPDPERLVLRHQAVDALHPVVGIDRRRRDEAVRVPLERLRPDALGITHADHAPLDPPQVHLPEGDPDGVLRTLERTLGHVLEHVLDRKGELLLRLLVLGLPGDEPVDLLHVATGEADHRVHDPHVLWHSHRLVSSLVAGGRNGPPSPCGRWLTGHTRTRILF